MALHLDIIDGSRAKDDGQGWAELERIAIVTGLTGDGQAKFQSALSVAGLPEVGDKHPVDRQLELMERSISCPGPDVAHIALSYKRVLPLDGGGINPPGAIVAPVITLSTGLHQIEANKDNGLSLTTLTYTNAKSKGFPDDLDDQIATFAKQVPQAVMTIKKRIMGPIALMAVSYVGRINALSWAGCAAKTWLCSAIDGTSGDGNKSYDTSFVFTHCGDTETGTWDINAYWRSTSGKVPTDLTPNQGIKEIKVYSTADFNDMHLI